MRREISSNVFSIALRNAVGPSRITEGSRLPNGMANRGLQKRDVTEKGDKEIIIRHKKSDHHFFLLVLICCISA